MTPLEVRLNYLDRHGFKLVNRSTPKPGRDLIFCPRNDLDERYDLVRDGTVIDTYRTDYQRAADAAFRRARDLVRAAGGLSPNIRQTSPAVPE